MLKTALRIKYNQADYCDFDEEEVRETIVSTIARRKIYSNIENYYGIYKIGLDTSRYRIVDIEFFLKYGGTSGTLAKIETLYNAVDSKGQPSELYCYWKYKITPLTYIPVKMIRQGMKWNYVGGRSTLRDVLPLSFVEVKVSGIGMLQPVSLQLAGSG